METGIKYVQDQETAYSYSLGILIEWKPPLMAIANSEAVNSYSLGILIEWKPDRGLGHQ